MSTASQNNGKKSSNSSVVNTPASTPITNINGNGQVHNSPPPNNNAPKYGTLVPNRIFVGGISAQTTEAELAALFGSYGAVRAAKIIQDRAGVSKGYGFVTFESEDDARRPLRDADAIVLRERKLNVAPAIKKQPFGRAFDASSPPVAGAGGAGAPAPFFFPAPPGAGAAGPYFPPAGVAYYAAPPPPPPSAAATAGPPHGPQNNVADHQQGHVYQPPPVYPGQTGPPQTTYPSMMFPQTIYMPQQYPLPMPYDYGYYQAAAGAPSPFGAAPQQGGGGGGGGPGSPPRVSAPQGGGGGPPPYGDLFYGAPLPVYGGHMDGVGPLVYGEGFDVVGQAVPAYAAPPEDPYASLAPLSGTATAATNTTPTIANTPEGGTPDASSSAATPEPEPAAAALSRSSATPVVSLLSIDQHQEKDYAAMQGGRRRKPPPPPPAAQLPTYFAAAPPQVYGAGAYHQMNGTGHQYNGYHHHHHHNNNNGRMNGGRRRTYGERRHTAPVDASNEDEEGGGMTPPPPPYSPMANHQHRLFVSRSYQPRPFKANGRGPQHHHHHHQQQQMQPYGMASQQQQQQQAPPAHQQQQRRGGRRSIRRGPNEIGAGDAPLPAPAAAPDDVAKKFDALKL